VHHGIIVSVRTTITLDDDVYEAAQSLSKASGQSLSAVLSQLARRGLSAQRDFAARNDLPVFKVPANAPLIPSNRVRRLDSEEST
jgi:hypothetical protein